MPKVTEEHRLARQDEIIAAALVAFRRKGFQATSMSEIIAESGLSAGAIYGYFASKTDIVYAVATKIVGARIVDLDNLAQLDPMPDPAVMIRNVLQGLIDAMGLPTILLQVWGEAVTDATLRDLCRGIFTTLRDAMTLYLTRWQRSAHGLSDADARRVAEDQVPLFIGVVNGFVVQDSLVADFDRERYLTETLPYLPR
ncbi:MAG TPA: TetR/AcrR family transcriptional regulator [Galbitalea sp.]|jgi:AcrR family transcriptional regulator|nr:TetR/AcrR family transcriptional regulator [Galbitalea sp.]